MIWDRSATVLYFVKTLGMDITKFDEVVASYNIYFCLMFTTYLLGGVPCYTSEWLGYYSNMHYIFLF